MRGSLISIFLLTVSFISASQVLAGDEQIVRFKSSAKVRVAGQDHLVVIADAPRGGHTTRLVVGNKTEGRFDPIPEQADAIKGLHSGDLIQVTAETANGVSTLQSIATYSPKARNEEARNEDTARIFWGQEMRTQLEFSGAEVGGARNEDTARIFWC